MIQRIQTIFLLITAGLCFSMLFVDIAQFIDTNTITLSAAQYSDENGKMIESTHIIYQQVILISIIALINFITIFLFKKRMLQMRLCIYSIILQVALIGMLGFYIWLGSESSTIKFGIGSFIPFITIILTYLAFHAIRKDERLVRSLDRIR